MLNQGAGNGQKHILKSEEILKTVESGGNFWWKKDKAFSSKNKSWAKGNLGGVGTQDVVINSLSTRCSGSGWSITGWTSRSSRQSTCAAGVRVR